MTAAARTFLLLSLLPALAWAKTDSENAPARAKAPLGIAAPIDPDTAAATAAAAGQPAGEVPQKKCPGVADEPDTVGNQPCAAEVTIRTTDLASTPDVRYPYPGVINNVAPRAPGFILNILVPTLPGASLPGLAPARTGPPSQKSKDGGDQ